ncbi:MAG: aspartate kinase [Clostridiales bacterium]|nr:aspartate kinase [Clostridiales bacterium]
MIVSKFGGSSLADASQIQKVCDIIIANSERKVVVVSAPGVRTANDTKVTDLLIALGKERLSGSDGEVLFNRITERFSDIAVALRIEDVLPVIKKHISDTVSQPVSNPDRFMDAVKSLGEHCCARIVAAYLNRIGIKAKFCDPKEFGLLLSSTFGRIRVLPKSYEHLSKLRDVEGICVFPGFYGYTPEGEIMTFSRGGSDVTGSILAAAVEAQVYENWTDVDCVYAVNPKLVNHPFPIREITYAEMRELAYAGFTVLHEEALYPAFQKGIPVHIRNTNNPSRDGTYIVAKRSVYDSLVTGIAGENGFCTLNIKKYLMNREVGFAVKVLSIIADEGLSFEHMPSGIDSISIVLRGSDFTIDKEDRIVDRIRKELNIDDVFVHRNLAIVMIVGEAMANTVGTTARAAQALSKAGINLEIINQGASEISVMFGVREEYCNYAVRVLYNEFFNK